MRHLPLDKSNNFQVFAVDKVGLAAGDAVRITQNGYTQADKDNRQKHYLANGSIYRVKNFTKQGHIELQNGWVVPKNYGGLTHGYCTTSHTAQGKTVDRVFIAQSADSFRATSKEQFYVSVKSWARIGQDLHGRQKSLKICGVGVIGANIGNGIDEQ